MTIREELLRLLQNDPEVQAAVQALFEREHPQLAPLSAEEEMLFGGGAVENERDTETFDTIARQERELLALRQQQAKMQDVLAGYARLEAVYGDYQALPASVREEVGQFLNDSSPLAFAVTGAELEVLTALYKVVCHAQERQVRRTLNACFDLLFDLFLLKNPGFRRIVTHEGDVFDPERHALAAGSIPAKRVLEVVISGFTGGGMIVRSCVRTGEHGFPEQL